MSHDLLEVISFKCELEGAAIHIKRKKLCEMKNLAKIVTENEYIHRQQLNILVSRITEVQDFF